MMATANGQQVGQQRRENVTDIYDRFDAAFRHVSAFAILKDGKHVANVCLKHGGAVTAFVHWIGLEMTTGRAGGGGYDKASAAVVAAARKTKGGDAPKATQLDGDAFIGALIDGPTESAGWQRALEQRGYTVCNVIV
jgi:hypothetical protein